MSSAVGSDSLAGNIYPDQTPRHAVPEPSPLVDFKPWHLPRKQWLRKKQWAASAQKLIEELGLDRPLRYVGLPGTELLDLEVLADLCQQKGTILKYLGFNTGAQAASDLTTQRLAEDLLRSHAAVDRRSLVCGDDILTVESKNSIAFRRLKDFESFDVVNLDLCGVFTTTPRRSVHAAVKNLLEFQVNGRTQPWLLFVTTVVDRAAVAENDVTEYQARFDDNALKWDDFGRLVGEIAGADVQRERHPFAAQSQVAFGKLLTVAIGKWLCAVLKTPTPWKVSLRSCAHYRSGLKGRWVDGPPFPEPDLFSMVFGIERMPQVLSDPFGLAIPAQAQAVPRAWEAAERDMAIQMLGKAQRSIDLDLMLQRLPNDRDLCLEECAAALELRNYDVAAYRDYVRTLPKLPDIADG